MWQTQHMRHTTADAQAVWGLYAEVATWPVWDPGCEAVTLDGPFETGLSG
jgi:hypothetical protein